MHDERCALLWLLPRGFQEARAKALIDTFGVENAARLAGVEPLVLLVQAEYVKGLREWACDRGMGPNVVWRRQHVDRMVEAIA